MKIRCLLSIIATASVTAATLPESPVAKATIIGAIEVRQVSGTAEYAYGNMPWQPLRAGQVLRAGASVRAGTDSAVLLAMDESGSFVRVSPATRLDLSRPAPVTEAKCPNCGGLKNAFLTARKGKAGH